MRVLFVDDEQRVLDGLRRMLRSQRHEWEMVFVESGEAAFNDMTTAIAEALNLGKPQDWPLAAAEAEWGYEMANYGLGSNSRVRGKHARELLGWAPKRTSVVEWIRREMV